MIALQMPRDQTVWPTVSFTNVNSVNGTFSGGSINLGIYNMIYSTTTYTMTVANVIDLNSRSFTFNSMSAVNVRAGRIGFISLDFDLTGTAGSANKYEITLPAAITSTLPTIACIGEFIAYETTSTNIFDLRQAMIYTGGKIRITGNNTINTSINTNDYAFSFGKRWVGNIKFKYII